MSSIPLIFELHVKTYRPILFRLGVTKRDQAMGWWREREKENNERERDIGNRERKEGNKEKENRIFLLHKGIFGT